MKKKLYLATVRGNEIVRRFMTRKHRGVEKILVIAGISIIALLLVSTTKTQLETFVTTIFGKILTKAEAMLGL